MDVRSSSPPPLPTSETLDPWNDSNLIPLGQDPSLFVPERDISEHGNNYGPRKRTFDDFNVSFGDLYSPAGQDWLAKTFPDLVPSVPLLAERTLDLGVENPFAIDNVVVHPRLRSRPVAPVLRNEGAVDGLIKFRFQLKQNQSSNRRRPVYDNSTRENTERANNPFLNPLPNLPRDFGRGMKLEATDAKLLKFYTVAFCTGRTLLPESNGFLNDIMPMASGNACVKHALLALASTYVLDYLPSKELEKRANMHHKRAVILLGQELNKEETYKPGSEDGVVGALVLLCHNDLVNWEIDRERSKSPIWLTGNQTAKMVLDKSDPGYRYMNPMNVQSSKARRYLGNKAALADIFCSVAAPLATKESSCPYPWLLEGNEREVRRIDGLNGLAPKLLHTYAQVTHLATRIAADPTSMIAPMAGKVLEKRLHNFQQWSDFSEGYPSPEALLAGCQLDAAGKVTSPIAMTEIIAESYVASAQVYLQCRLFRLIISYDGSRKPRGHPAVQNITNTLVQCIARMPTSGPLFTAQSPLFSVFIAGTVAYQPSDRQVLKDWFIGTVSGTRGNVPPAWRAMQTVWRWQDEVLVHEESQDNAAGLGTHLDDEAVTRRRAWWEEMVEVIEQEEGRMNLA